jgi:cytochrome bd-type quinol oxidase subunit 2
MNKPPSPPSAWRSFVLLLLGLLAVGVAAWNLVASRAGAHAFRWLLLAFIGVIVSLGVGLALDWARMDRWTRGFQIAALATSLLFLVVVAVVFPGILQQLWET